MENNPENPINTPVETKQKHKSKNNVWWALILVLAGAIMLVQNITGGKFIFNWWALFIFLPVFGSLSTAWNGYRENNQYTVKVGNSLGSAILIGTVATILMFGMNWMKWWPLVILAGGLSLLLGGLGRFEKPGNGGLPALSHLGAWIGLGGIVLGMGFLINSVPIPALQPYLQGYRWWAAPILLAGLGTLINTAVMFFENEHQMNWAAWSMLLVSVFILAIGVLVLLNMNINLLFPIVLIACGLVILIGLFQRK